MRHPRRPVHRPRPGMIESRRATPPVHPCPTQTRPSGVQVRTVLRYLGGAVLVAVLIVGGVVVRVIQVGHLDRTGSRPTPSSCWAPRNTTATRHRCSRPASTMPRQLYRDGVAPRIVTIGGGQTGDRTTEGAAGAAYLADLGIEQSALTAVGSGDDTLASLRAADTLLTDNGWTSVVLVTDPWHAARSALMATDLGLQVQVSPVQQGPSVRRWRRAPLRHPGGARGALLPADRRFLRRRIDGGVTMPGPPARPPVTPTTDTDRTGSRSRRSPPVCPNPSAPAAAARSPATGPGCCTPGRSAGWPGRPRWSRRTRTRCRAPG